MGKTDPKHGIVYVMSNPSMPEMVKIGITQQSVERRKNTLSRSTAVPTPFEVEHECEVDDCQQVEKALHTAFRPWRVSDKREFFRIKPYQVIAILELIETKNTTGKTAEASAAKRNPRFHFAEMGIPVGAQLAYVRNDTVTATVCEADKMEYEGKRYSLSALTRKLTGYTIRPTQYWEYRGKNLLDAYAATYLMK